MLELARSTTHPPRELFRFARIDQPRIIDVALRAKAVPELASVLKADPAEQHAWAESQAQEGALVTGLEDLEYDYLKGLKLADLDPHLLPDRSQLRNDGRFPGEAVRRDPAYASDHRRALTSVVAYQILKDREKLAEAARTFDFVDSYPRLDRVTRPLPYAAPVSRRARVQPRKRPERTPEPPERTEIRKRHDRMKQLSSDVRLLWQARNGMLRESRHRYEAAIKELKGMRFQPPPRPADDEPPPTAQKESSSQSLTLLPSTTRDRAKRASKAAVKEHLGFLRKRNAKLQRLRDEHQANQQHGSMAMMLAADPEALADHFGHLSAAEARAIQARIKEGLATYGIPVGRFCQLFETAVVEAEKTGSADALVIEGSCFAENPALTFEDDVRVLGPANLIKVEETFLGYRLGEISYIENILAGEVRKREVKSARYFEDSRETIAEETTEASQEASSATKQELASEIESEIETRFSSDITASVNASGGGNIGVVDLSGGAALNADLGVGVDTSLASTSSSKFSQEIVDKAVEKTRKSTLERRLSRTYSLFETADLHEIDNRGESSRSGIYCFLDKEVCIRETTYGRRLFLLANLALPGRNLLCERNVGMALNLLDQGAKPVFDITPADIHPHNYMELVGRFRASNVPPPPPPIQTLARTYKTDTTNTNVEQQEFNVQKVADILVPLFARYKRFLINDTVTIPEGYRVQDVTVTVNHGSNGVSIPAHLPFSVGGAALYSTPSLMSAIPYAGLTLPYAFWQIAYLASPLLHYNTDSSNVTVSVGNESHDSAYYFFQPDFLIQEVFGLLSNFSALSPDLLDTIRGLVDGLLTDLGEKAGEMSEDLGNRVATAVGDVMARVEAIFAAVQTAVDPANAVNIGSNLTTLGNLITNLAAEVQTALADTDFSDLMGEAFFEPFREFLNDVLDMISAELTEAVSEALAFLTGMFENSDHLGFYSVAGLTGEIPVSFNTVSIKPGITINLTACAVRTEESLDRWRLETFTSLYQAYLQQMAEYENRLLMASPAERRVSPGIARAEERRAVKELVLHALNNRDADHGNRYTLERINFFENAIDWANMSYKLYNYGPHLEQVRLQKLGGFDHADDRRKAFLTAHWAQVLIPVQENPHLEGQVVKYFEDGTFDFEGDLTDEELAVLYQNLILGRELLGDGDSTKRRVTLPTDFVVLQEALPANDDYVCP